MMNADVKYNLIDIFSLYCSKLENFHINDEECQILLWERVLPHYFWLKDTVT